MTDQNISVYEIVNELNKSIKTYPDLETLFGGQSGLEPEFGEPHYGTKFRINAISFINNILKETSSPLRIVIIKAYNADNSSSFRFIVTVITPLESIKKQNETL